MNDITKSYENKLTKRGHELSIPLYKDYYVDNKISVIDITDKKDKYNEMLDFKMSIDTLVRISLNNTKFKTAHKESPLTVTFSERFRDSNEFFPYQDLTITEYSHNSGYVSELYKLNCERFMYGYINDTSITQCVIIDSPKLKELFSRNMINYEYKHIGNERNQSFIYFDFNELYKHGLILYEYLNPNMFTFINEHSKLLDKFNQRNIKNTPYKIKQLSFR